MPRYVTIQPNFRTSSCDGEECPMLVGQTVYEADREPVRIGVLNADGTPIYRINDREPMGFWVGGR